MAFTTGGERLGKGSALNQKENGYFRFTTVVTRTSP